MFKSLRLTTFYILTFFKFLCQAFLKLFFKKCFFAFFRRLFIILSFLRIFVKKFFLYFFKSFLTVYFVEIIDFVFLQDFYKFYHFSLYFVKNFFYNFLTFNISKCLIVRLLLKKTFTILSSVLL